MSKDPNQIGIINIATTPYIHSYLYTIRTCIATGPKNISGNQSDVHVQCSRQKFVKGGPGGRRSLQGRCWRA